MRDRVLVMELMLLFLSLIPFAKTEAFRCEEELLRDCFCGEIIYQDKVEYVVNCTGTRFTDTNVLQFLPEQVQVLIFTGNFIPQLPWNVFGTTRNYSKLRVVDMSNNNIKEILGKTYHRVSNVERLVLNHNEISISSGSDSSENHHHPRIFSNFENLKELHLTNAFADKSGNLAPDLHDIFVNSNLTKLIKLHLEQNEISEFKDERVFCDLPQLMDLHLGDNLMTGIDFEISCLRHLRYIDLESNRIRVLTPKELRKLDDIPSRNQSLKIDLRNNPFSCECSVNDLFVWLQKTKVTVFRKDMIRCYRDQPLGVTKKELTCVSGSVKSEVASAQHQATEIVLGLLLVVLVILCVGLIYTNRKAIRYTFNPLLDNVSRKVHYTSIGHYEDQEVEV